jgi:GNAT superfamily N-acetyltransferase
MIRLAIASDLHEMVEMGRKFHAHAGIAEAPFDAESFAATLAHGMKTESQAYFVAEQDGKIVGMTGGVSYPAYFNHGCKAAQEMFWWCESPGAGRRLYAALEAWARGQGCKMMTMIALQDSSAERMGRLYKRMGYRPSEHCYIKGL